MSATGRLVLLTSRSIRHDLRPSVFVIRELFDRKSERLQIPRDSEWSGVDGLKADIVNQLRHHVLRIVVVAAIKQARTAARFALRVEDIEQNFARDGAEALVYGPYTSAVSKD